MGIHYPERERATRDRAAEPAAAPPDVRERQSISQILMLQRTAGKRESPPRGCVATRRRRVTKPCWPIRRRAVKR
jgi:hypothetical protein